MTDSNFPADALGTNMFPQFKYEIYNMIASEIEGLTDTQLDFDSDRWGWSVWSIRRNVSHMASGEFRWLIERWGERLFNDGVPLVEDLDSILSTRVDRRLDEDVYWQIEDILAVMRRGLDLAWSVLSRETVASMRATSGRSGSTSGATGSSSTPRLCKISSMIGPVPWRIPSAPTARRSFSASASGARPAAYWPSSAAPMAFRMP